MASQVTEQDSGADSGPRQKRVRETLCEDGAYGNHEMSGQRQHGDG